MAEGKTKKSEQKSRTVYCSFCGKSQHEVLKVIAGPSVFVCDECTDLCCQLLLEEHPDDPEILPRSKNILNHAPANEVDFTKLGVKPRFNKLKFKLKNNYIFYLCPFQDPFDAIYRDHIRPTANSMGFTIDRADEIYGTQPIIEDIWEAINCAEIIIADVSGRNPNVMYEIGMAHTIGKPVVIITQSIDDVPFDLRHHRCIVYSYTPPGCRDLQSKIEGTLRFIGGRSEVSE